MTTDQCEGNLGVRRGFGFDIESAYSAPRGASSREASTQRVDGRLDLDRPGDGRLPVLLTNSVHPDGHKDLKAFRSEAATPAARAIRRR